jgi:hypothetical protein
MKTENEARNETTCVGCGKHKDIGLVVCWGCFKHRENPLKYCEVSFEKWQMQIGALT